MFQSERRATFSTLLRFHLHVGARVSLRINAAVLAALFGLSYLLRPEFIFFLARIVYVNSHFLIPGIVSAAVSLSIALVASPRVSLGLDGWTRHLPAANSSHRRLAALAILTAELPILVVLAALIMISALNSGKSPAAYVAGLPFVGLASAAFSIPVKRRKLCRPAAAAACILLGTGIWIFLASGILLLYITDRISGPIHGVRKPPSFRRFYGRARLDVLIAWRAVSKRIFIPFLASGVVLVFNLFFLRNNPLSPSLALKASRLGGIMSTAVLLALLANSLAAQRPPWPWARSLPRSARQRINFDALFLCSHTIPVLVLSSLLNFQAVLTTAASLPFMGLRAARAMRRAPEQRYGAASSVLLEGFLEALAIALLPWISVLFLLTSPLASKEAALQEQRQKVSRWLELHHLAAGDSLSWSR